MKKLISVLIFLLPLSIYAQRVGINTTMPDTSAILDINSTEGGLLIPRMTLFQRDVIPNPATGLLVYQTDFNQGFYYYDGFRWRPFTTLAINGLNLDAATDRIQLGGDLIKNTTVTQGIYNMIYDLDSTGLFEIKDNGSTFFHANDEGKIGIGTAAPIEQLHTTGNIRTDGRRIYFGPAQQLFGNDGSQLTYQSNQTSISNFILRDSDADYHGSLYGTLNGDLFGLLDGDGQWGYLQAKDDYTQFRINNDTKMTIRDNGHVGIGTASPSGKLTVVVDPAARGLEVFSANGSTHIPWTNGWSYLAGEGIIFRTTAGNLEQVRITPNGFTGFGVNDPNQRIHSVGNLQVDGRYIYFGPDMSLYGDNSSAYYLDGNHSTITQLILRDKENLQYGRIYGSGDGARFGLLDGDGNWAIRLEKDVYTSFHIDNVEKYRLTDNSLEFRNFDNNIAIGRGVNTSTGTGQYNVGIGLNALADFTIANNNIGIGHEASRSLVNGSHNIGIGSQALRNNGIGSNNIGIGHESLLDVSNGTDNVGIGNEVLSNIVNGSRNVAIGFRAGEIATSNSANNSFVGALSGRQLRGLDNTCLGYNSGVGGSVLVSYNNSTAVGANSRITGSNQVRIGSNLVASIGGFQDWTRYSDRQFKTNIKEDVPGLDFIMELRPVTYNFNTDQLKSSAGLNEVVAGSPSLQEAERLIKNQLETGFVAQEVEAAAGKLGYDFSGVDKPQNSEDHYGLRYSTFVVPLVKSVQEQQEIIKEQNAKIEALESANDQILGELEAIKKLLEERD